jgi:predicted permease
LRRVFRLPVGTRHLAREVDDELAFHLEMRVQRLESLGWSNDAALQEALRQFGDVEAVRTSCVTLDEQRERARNRSNMITELQQDIIYALRTLRRNRGFTATIVIALAFGIGANTAIFSLVDAVLMRRLDVAHPEQLVVVGNPARVNGLGIGTVRTDVLSYPLYKDLRADSGVFSGVVASGSSGRLDVRIASAGTELEHPVGRFASGNYFAVLGVPAFIGRTFDADADVVLGSSPVAVISHGYWTRRFHNDRSVIGRQITIDDNKITIIGVTPPDFQGEVVGSSYDIWLPVSMRDALRPTNKILNDRSVSWLLALGRLKPGATLAQAQDEIPAILRRHIMTESSPQQAKEFGAEDRKYFVSDGSKGFSRVRDTFHAPLITLMIGVALLLCIICANVANLLLARAVARGREMSVRLALGADRARLIRQLLTESALLALLSAGAGLVLASLGSHALLVMASQGTTIPLRLGLDTRVLLFTMLTSVAAVALFGLVPALHASRVDLASTMRGGARNVAGSTLAGCRSPLGAMLVAGQVALSIVLLVGAAMLVRSLRNVQTTDVGLDRDHLIIVDVDAASRGYENAHLAPLTNRLRDRLAAVPGVAAVGFSENGIFSGTESATNVQVPGFVMREPADSNIAYDQVSAGYVRAIGARLVAGRDLEARDEAALPRTAIVNEALASFYFPRQNAVGKYLRFNDSVSVEIVGVVADTRDHDLASAPRRRAYFPYVHGNDAANLDFPGTLRLEVRTKQDPATMVQVVRQAVMSVEPNMAISGVDPLATLMRESIGQERLLARLASAFGVLALLLAAVGLYGVMTYAITRRTGEIGLRVALGARRLDVVRMVLGDALRLVALGIVVGLPLALGSARLLRTQLHAVPVVDPVSIVLAIGVLTASAVLAGLLPARRAAGVSPIVALRAE